MFNRLNVVTIFIYSLLLVFNHVVPAYAGFISIEKLMSQQVVSHDRETIYMTIERDDVQLLLEKHGVNAEQAKQRVNALTDKEVKILSHKFDELPAAGEVGVAAAVLILVLLIIALALSR